MKWHEDMYKISLDSNTARTRSMEGADFHNGTPVAHKEWRKQIPIIMLRSHSENEENRILHSYIPCGDLQLSCTKISQKGVVRDQGIQRDGQCGLAGQ